jgi:hypothetical protein
LHFVFETKIIVASMIQKITIAGKHARRGPGGGADSAVCILPLAMRSAIVANSNALHHAQRESRINASSTSLKLSRLYCHNGSVYLAAVVN